MLLWVGLSTSSSCLNSISDSRIVVTTRPPACTWDKWCDQKLMIDLEWPNYRYHSHCTDWKSMTKNVAEYCKYCDTCQTTAAFLKMERSPWHCKKWSQDDDHKTMGVTTIEAGQGRQLPPPSGWMQSRAICAHTVSSVMAPHLCDGCSSGTLPITGFFTKRPRRGKWNIASRIPSRAIDIGLDQS